jgi:hypothetical protein
MAEALSLCPPLGDLEPKFRAIATQFAQTEVPLADEHLTPFADVPGDHWAAQAVADLRSNGIVVGYGGNRFFPEGPNVRQAQDELVAKLYEILKDLPFYVELARDDDQGRRQIVEGLKEFIGVDPDVAQIAMGLYLESLHPNPDDGNRKIDWAQQNLEILNRIYFALTPDWTPMFESGKDLVLKPYTGRFGPDRPFASIGEFRKFLVGGYPRRTKPRSARL